MDMDGINQVMILKASRI